MGTSRKSTGGQRTNTTSASGNKSRSTTSSSHGGSRVEPSHITEHSREARAQKAATRATKKPAPKKKG